MSNSVLEFFQYCLSVRSIAQGMRYLHFSQVRIHGNLKSGNCVIDSRWVLKVTNFGVSGIYERYQIKMEQNASKGTT